MFEVGKSYRFVWLETANDDDGKSIYSETSTVYEIGAVDGTLVTCLGPDWAKVPEMLRRGIDTNSPRDETIINTAGLFFVRAELQHDADE